MRYRVWMASGLLLAIVAAGAAWGLRWVPLATEDPAGQVLERIRERGEVRVLTRNAPTTYYFGRTGPAGLEYDLVSRFAEALGVELQLVVLDGFGEVLKALERGRGDIAAAGITAIPERKERFDFGPSYQQVQQEVVCRRGGFVPDTLGELPEAELLVLAGTSYVERLQELKAKHEPKLDWRVTDDLSSEEILERVWQEQVDCTVADSNVVAINRRYFPELKVAFPITHEQPLAWALPEGAEKLRARLVAFFDDLRANNTLKALRERYYGHITIFDYVDVATFRRRIRERLPKYRALFQRVAEEYPFSWELLAAQAYQESHWEPHARSPTGVRGLMMLTQPTARELGIDNRLDPEASVRGGAEYLQRMRDRLPDDIEEPDRTWIALAAYNVGMGHVRDARKLAQRAARNPDRWNALKDMLPRLSRPEYYKTVPYGYTRGTEPVKYVDHIRQFYAILTNHTQGPSRVPDPMPQKGAAVWSGPGG